MKKRILFVDDDENVLAGLRASLRKQRSRWEMVFAPGGERAKAVLADAAFDVLVTDMRMPGVDGAALLRHVQEHHPEMVRIVLSGFAEEEEILRTLPVAHQFLSKPCEASVLENVIDRACNVQQLLENDDVKRRIGTVDTLPSLPRNYHELNQVMIDANATFKDIAAIIERDIAMSAKLLQIVNSAFFGLSRQLSSISDAIGYLGLEVVKNLVLSLEVFGTFGEKDLCDEISLETLTHHSLFAARIAKRILDDPEQGKDAFAAAVLHDVGELVIAAHLPEVMGASFELARKQDIPFHTAEIEVHGFGHAEIGAFLLGRWGLPYPVIEAVAYHHNPQQVKQSQFDLLSAVHIADVLASEFHQAHSDEDPLYLDMEYLESLGAHDQVADWRQIAEEEAEVLAEAG